MPNPDSHGILGNVRASFAEIAELASLDSKLLQAELKHNLSGMVSMLVVAGLALAFAAIAAAFLAVAGYNGLLSLHIRPVAAALLVFLSCALCSLAAMAAFRAKMKMWSLWPSRTLGQISATFASVKTGLFDVRRDV